MTTFLKANIDITRQEGDTADIKFLIPEIIDLIDRQARFQVKDGFGKILIDIPGSIQGQEITVALNAQATKGVPGTHKWEVELTRSEEVITIASGKFNIVKELIK